MFLNNFILIPELDFWFFAYVFFAVGALFPVLLMLKINNPMGTVLFFLISILNQAGLLILLGYEFFALALILIYAGAILLLYLFVIMLLRLPVRDWSLTKLGSTKFIGLLFFTELVCVFQRSFFETELVRWYSNHFGCYMRLFDYLQFYTMDSRGLGFFLFTTHAFLFFLQGVILLLALLGSIFLTSESRRGA